MKSSFERNQQDIESCYFTMLYLFKPKSRKTKLKLLRISGILCRLVAASGQRQQVVKISYVKEKF